MVPKPGRSDPEVNALTSERVPSFFELEPVITAESDNERIAGEMVPEPTSTAALKKLKSARSAAKRSHTRLVNRIYSMIGSRVSYIEIHEDESKLVTSFGLVTEAHNAYVTGLGSSSGDQEVEWLSIVETTYAQCHADMEKYFRSALPVPAISNKAESTYSSKSKSSIASTVRRQTEHIFDKINADLAKERAEDRELRSLEEELKKRRSEVMDQRALRAVETKTEKLNLSRNLARLKDSDSESSADSELESVMKVVNITTKIGKVNGLADGIRLAPEAADSWIDEELAGRTQPVTTGLAGGAPWMSSLMPQFEFPKFDGDPRKWIEFMASFKSLVHDVIPSNALRLGVLRQMLEPNVRVSLGKTLNDPRLYPQTLDQLKRRFGDPYRIARAHMQALEDLKPVRGDNLSELRNFWYELRGSVINLQHNGGDVELNCGTNVERLVRKLSTGLRKQWGRRVIKLRPAISNLGRHWYT